MNVEFEVGDAVTYVPTHALGDLNHPDCERGIVSSISENKETIFVRYYSNHTGGLKLTAQGTNPRDLRK